MKITLNSILNLLLAGAFLLWIGRYVYFLPRHHSGEPAPAFSAALIDGSLFELADARGNYVLLDFWGSWCGPCRQENPAWISVYQKYRQRQLPNGGSFFLVSIGIERNESSWRRAIERDQLFWPHHILDTSGSLRFFNGGIAKLYGVKSLPANFLIDPQGMIIGVNLKPEEVDRRLSTLLP